MLTGDNIMGKLHVWSNDKISPVLTSACGQNVLHKICLSASEYHKYYLIYAADNSYTYNIVWRHLIAEIDLENYGFWNFQTSNNHLKIGSCRKYQLKCIHITLITL